MDQRWDTAPEKEIAERSIAHLVNLAEVDQTWVVDLGCGSGRLRGCLKRVEEYVGVDVHEPMLALARERWINDGRCFFWRGSLFDPPHFHGCGPTLVICVAVARHHEAPLDVWRAALRWPARHYLLGIVHGAQTFSTSINDGTAAPSHEVEEFLRGRPEQVAARIDTPFNPARYANLTHSLVLLRREA